jgi:hypothetical protein
MVRLAGHVEGLAPADQAAGDGLHDANYWVVGFARLQSLLAGKTGVAAVPALLQALDDGDDDLRGWAAASLEELGDPPALPLIVVAASDVPVSERVVILEALRAARPRDGRFRYKIGSVLEFCRDIQRLDSVEDEVMAGARAVDAHLTLVRAASRHSEAEPTELLRAASADPATSPPDQLLRPSDGCTDRPATAPGCFYSLLIVIIVTYLILRWTSAAAAIATEPLPWP